MVKYTQKMERQYSYNDLTYDLVYNFELEVMETILKKDLSDDQKRSLIRHFYCDPDSYPGKGRKMRGDILCTADGLLSIKRILEMEKLEDVVGVYRKYRKTPLIFFPSQQGSINQSRATVFGDKIDLTLNDLRRYCIYREGKLKDAYELPKTKKWLESFDYNFGAILDWMGIKDLFINQDGAVYDIEKSDGSVLDPQVEYQGGWVWSKDYYEHIKDIIKKYGSRLSILSPGNDETWRKGQDSNLRGY